MRTFLFLLFFYAKADCPEGWIKETFWCYKVFEGGANEKTWNTAESDCNKFGADLVDIQSETEKEKVRKKAQCYFLTSN